LYSSCRLIDLWNPPFSLELEARLRVALTATLSGDFSYSSEGKSREIY
jgi:hypothetical protein